VTQPALTYYFPTRDDLLIAVLEWRDAQGRAIGSGEQSGTLTENMVASTRHTTDHPGLAKLYVTLAAASTDPDSPVHDYFLDRYRTLAAEATKGFETAQQAGAIRDDLPADHLARAVLAVLDGLQMQWMHDPTVDIDAVAESFARALTPPGTAGQV
jgi:AcrR family transcriptional regulator